MIKRVNKERLQKKARERYQNLSEDKKEKNNNMVVKDIKIRLHDSSKFTNLTILRENTH